VTILDEATPGIGHVNGRPRLGVPASPFSKRVAIVQQLLWPPTNGADVLVSR